MTSRTLMLLFLMVAVPLLLFAGGQDEGGAEAGDRIDVNPEGVFPIVDETATLNVFGPAVEFEIEENAYTQWLEETTNVHVEWDLVPGNSLVEKRNLLLSSGDYPDVFLQSQFRPSLQMIYGSRGVLVALNDLMEEYGENLRRAYQENPWAEQAMRSVDGNFYAIPVIKSCLHCQHYRGRFWVYQPWLDELGLEHPETLEEFHQMLLAFKNEDPNGNGESDEIPLSGAMGHPYYNNDTHIDLFVMNAFVYDDAKDRLILRDDRIEVVYDDPEWRDGLRYLNMLYQDGLIHQEAFVQQVAQLKALGENEVPILGATPAGHPARFTQYGGESGRFLEYSALAPLIGPDGERRHNYDPYIDLKEDRMVITSAADAAVAFRWADAQLSEEGTLRMWLGRPGIEWDYAEPGDGVGANGEPAYIVENTDLYDAAQNVAWGQFGPNYRRDELFHGRLAPESPEERRADINTLLYDVTKEKYEPYAVSGDVLVPPLWFTEDQAAELADLRTSLTTYWEESMAQFIIGDLDIEEDWDRYLRELDTIGLDRYEDLLNAAYDAKYR